MVPSCCYDWLHTIRMIFIFIQTNPHPFFPSNISFHPLCNRKSILTFCPPPLLPCLSEPKMGELAFVATWYFLLLFFLIFTRGEIPRRFLASSLLCKDVCEVTDSNLIGIPLESIEDQLIVSKPRHRWKSD